MVEGETLQTLGLTLSLISAAVFAVLSLIASVRTNRNLSYAQARMKSIRNSLLLMFGFWLSLVVSGIIVKPDVAETALACTSGIAIFLFISYASAYFQIIVLSRRRKRPKQEE